MSQIILDFGSGNTCQNKIGIVKKMYDNLKAIDTGKHEIVCKWQLFEKAGDNIPLERDVFDYAYKYGTELGYKVTSSVFDIGSLRFLLQYDVPMIKIANRRDLDWLIGEVPRKIPVYVSFGKKDETFKANFRENVYPLGCISSYPATIDDYVNSCLLDILMDFNRKWGVSDHTTTFELWHRYQPQIIEWHYKLPDSTGLDAGPFARTPAALAEVL